MRYLNLALVLTLSLPALLWSQQPARRATPATAAAKPTPEARIASLREAAEQLDGVAEQRIPERLQHRDRAAAEEYQKWLKSSAQLYQDLAKRWETARQTPKTDFGSAVKQGAGKTDADFEQEFIELGRQVRAEHRKFHTISNVMKTKHDTAKNAINNVR